MSKEHAIIAHGGVWPNESSDPEELDRRHSQVETLKVIVTEGWDLISGGTSAVDVVQHVVNSMEASPWFNAGYGAEIGSEGQIECDASIMDGASLNAGGVTGVEGYTHPLSIARLVMDSTPHVLFNGVGADRTAREHGIEPVGTKALYTPYTEKLWKQFKKDQAEAIAKGTVGAVVRDREGNIAAGTSTGGYTGKPIGRIGDSPIIGAGTYADNKYAGICTSGAGEQFIRALVTPFAIRDVQDGMSAQEASERAIERLATLPDGFGGIIMIDNSGRIGTSMNFFGFPRVYRSQHTDGLRVATGGSSS